MATVGVAQVRARAVVMAGAAAVIVLAGGRAVLAGDPAGSGDGPLTTAAFRTVSSAGSRADGSTPSGDVPATTRPSSGSPTAVPGTGPALTPSSTLPVAVTLQQVTGVVAGGRRVALRGQLADPVTHRPVQGVVTLWRALGHGRWKRVVAERSTSTGGLVQFEVDQSSSTAVYRISVAAAGGRPRTTGPALTVRRPRPGPR